MAAWLSAADSVHDFSLKSIDGQDLPLSSFRGKAVLLVNTASRCGFTPQYAGLESLYNQYKDRGLVVLGVPANNFGGQEPGTNEEIKSFCIRTYKVTFPMTAKVSVKGADRDPLYGYLAQAAGEPRWNFTKYLVGRDGKVIRRFDSAVGPDSAELKTAIEAALSLPPLPAR
jgi:glutathione peroxidase